VLKRPSSSIIGVRHTMPIPSFEYSLQNRVMSPQHHRPFASHSQATYPQLFISETRPDLC
jgi:hypothetical protein